MSVEPDLQHEHTEFKYPEPPQGDEALDVHGHHGQQELENAEASAAAATTAAAAIDDLNALSTREKGFNVLSRIPLDIQEFRERLFTLEEPMTFDPQAWTKYWPFIDNVWCLHNRMDAPISIQRGHTEKFWGGCRLQRKWDHQASNPAPKGIRNRARRETGTCQAKFKLTVMPNGQRVLERSSKEGHGHDLDHIDSIKRNSGVRSLVLDPFFNAWEPATIMAYLRDSDHFVNGRDMLSEAGGKYLERREIMNIFSQHLRKLYPGIDVSAVKKEQDKYKSMKTCNFKGCNRSFADGKALMAHRKTDHPAMSEVKAREQQRKLYTCPMKGCHRKKKSKAFSSPIALRDHQIKMEHWGVGLYHGGAVPTPLEDVPEGTEIELRRSLQERSDEHALAAIQLHNEQVDGESLPPDQPTAQDHQTHLSQHSLSAAEQSLMPLIAQSVGHLTGQSLNDHPGHESLPIDPAMEAHPRSSTGLLPQQSLGDVSMQDPSPQLDEAQQKEAMMQRYQALEAEMARLRGVLFN